MTESSPENGFLIALAGLRDGDTLKDLQAALAHLISDIKTVGKAGTIALNLKISIAKGSVGTLMVTDEIVVKPPKPDTEVTIMYADEENILSRRDPRQPKLSGLTEVPAPLSFTRALTGD